MRWPTVSGFRMNLSRGVDTKIIKADDKGLALAFQRGEQDAYNDIYATYSARVESICRRMLSDPHDAQEATQEAFLRVYQGLPRFNGRYQLGAWIARVATNVCLDQLRARQRRPSDPYPIDELDLESPEFVLANDPEDFVIKRSEGRRVRKVLDSLPPLHRAAIVLRDFEGFTYEEVASALKITECQVKALLHRARKGFRRSWTSLAGLFFPARLLQRLRRVDQPDGALHVARAGQQVGDVAASSMGQAASSCGVMLQQCGQFVGERFAAVATTVVVGAAAVGGGAAVVRTEPQAREQAPVQIAAETEAAGATTQVQATRVKKNSGSSQLTSPTAGSPDQDPSAPTPSPTPSPTPADESTPPSGSSGQGSPTGGSGSGQTSSGSQKPTTPAYEFKPAVGFDRGVPIPATASKKYSVKLDCARQTMDQSFETTLWDGATGYPARVLFGASASAGRLQVSLTKDGKEFRYSSWGGQPTATWVVEGNKVSVEVSGEYGTLWDSPDPTSAQLPASGTFSVKVALDCAASTVITQGVTLATQ